MINKYINNEHWKKGVLKRLKKVKDVIIRIGHYENEVDFTQYNSDCFEYIISIKNDKTIENHKILVYLIGFVKLEHEYIRKNFNKEFKY